MKKLPLSALGQLFAAMAEQSALYIPADDTKGQAQFIPWTEGMALTKKLNTVRSAKDLFFPQVENLVNFKMSGKKIEVIENRDPAEPFVVFGVRACDCYSFDILDRVFLEEPADTYYQTRRENGTVITLACSRPAETCFCDAFGIDAADPQGDVTCWMTEDTLYWRSNTPKGNTLTAKLSMLEDSTDDAVRTQQEKTRAVLNKLPLKNLDLTGFDGDHLMDWFNNPAWAELSESCHPA